VPLAGLEHGLVSSDVGGIDFVQQRRMLRENRRGQSKRVLRLAFRPRQCGVVCGVVGALLQKIVEWHIQAKWLRWQCRQNLKRLLC